jgi:2-oxoglutarate dehydrogenase complex dehydrogenase (E1) component-like enzyme
VVLLSGKLYYDLAKERDAKGMNHRVALIRVEVLFLVSDPLTLPILYRLGT